MSNSLGLLGYAGRARNGRAALAEPTHASATSFGGYISHFLHIHSDFVDSITSITSNINRLKDVVTLLIDVSSLIC
jgi:hypothetical protein